MGSGMANHVPIISRRWPLAAREHTRYRLREARCRRCDIARDASPCPTTQHAVRTASAILLKRIAQAIAETFRSRIALATPSLPG